MKIKKILEVVSEFYSRSTMDSYCSTDELDSNPTPQKILNSFKDFRENVISSTYINRIEATIVFDNEDETEQTEIFNSIGEYEFWYSNWFDKNGEPLDKEYSNEKTIHKIIRVETELFAKALKSIVTLTEDDSDCSPDDLREEKNNYRQDLEVYTGTIYVTVAFMDGSQDSLTFDNIIDYESWCNDWFNEYGIPYDQKYTD